MYLPDHFAEARPEALTRIIREHPLGVLITHDADGLDARGHAELAQRMREAD